MGGYTNCIDSQYRKHRIQAKPLEKLLKKKIIGHFKLSRHLLLIFLWNVMSYNLVWYQYSGGTFYLHHQG